MEKPLLDITKLKFPVYILGKNGTIINENYYKIFRRWDGSHSIFDIEMDEPVFIKRRLYLLEREEMLPYPLKRLNLAINFYADLLKISNSSAYHFIDSDGKLFTYKKSRNVKLTFHPIEWWKFTRYNMSVIIKLKDSEVLYEAATPPKHGQGYVGLLHISNRGRVLHGYYDKEYDSTTRKI